jgi:hypothetical protein
LFPITTISSFFDIFIFSAGLHSDLTTQRQVTPQSKKIKKENKAAYATASKPSDLFEHRSRRA